MSQKTTLLTISSLKPSGTFQNCAVTPEAPLWIQELRLFRLNPPSAPKGEIPPGAVPTGSVRTISVDSSNPVFTTPAPFTLSVTYDDGTFLVSDLHVVQPVTSSLISPHSALDGGHPA